MTDDRIKLAAAMGWVACEFSWQEMLEMGELTAVPPNHPDPPGAGNLTVIPNPFEDANDDYAVLEWFRGPMLSKAWEFNQELKKVMYEPGHYEIGNYARAALKVLENE